MPTFPTLAQRPRRRRKSPKAKLLLLLASNNLLRHTQQSSVLPLTQSLTARNRHILTLSTAPTFLYVEAISLLRIINLPLSRHFSSTSHEHGWLRMVQKKFSIHRYILLIPLVFAVGYSATVLLNATLKLFSKKSTPAIIHESPPPPNMLFTSSQHLFHDPAETITF